MSNFKAKHIAISVSVILGATLGIPALKQAVSLEDVNADQQQIIDELKFSGCIFTYLVNDNQIPERSQEDCPNFAPSDAEIKRWKDRN